MFLNQINFCQLKRKENEVTKTDCYTDEDSFRGNKITTVHCGLSSLCICPKEKETGISHYLPVKTVLTKKTRRSAKGLKKGKN